MAPASFYVVQSDVDAAPSDPFSSPTSTPVSAPSSRSIDPGAAVEGLTLSPVDAKPNAGPAQRFRSGFQDLVHQSEAVQHLHVRALAARSTSLAPNDSQKVTLGVIAAYIVIISVLWVTPVIKWILWPFKMLTVAFHEFSHAATGCCTGAKIKSIELDPREGGCTMMAGGIGAITLPAGYLGSSLIGAVLIFCGFNISASKIIAIFVGVCFLVILWWARRDWLSILTILFATGMIVAFFFIAHGQALRWYMLFLGVMSSLYSVYDICDDLIFRKVNESDASVFAKRYGGSAQCWGLLWGLISLGFMAAAIVAGLAVFKEGFAVQAAEGQSFLPTRF
ncbi:hypothetical protein JCM8202_005343 [Rhodotorula sphaerocarpa]